MLTDKICETIQDHEKRIRDLEISDSTLRIRIDDLIKSVDKSTSWLKVLVITVIPCLVTLIAFLVENAKK